MDFLIFNENIKNGTVEISPDYICEKSNDLMIRGHRFYAIWNPETGMWCEDEDYATAMIDSALDKEVKSHEGYSGRIKPKKLKVASTGSMAKWHTYCRELMNDNFKPLNQRVLFTNSKMTKRDYASKTLSYPLQQGSMDAYDRLMSVLYSEDERHKIEWTIGAIVNGDNKSLQKFLVLYGGPGTGKSTVLNIVQMLFDGYCSVFDAEALGDRNNQFALQPFISNPVVAIQHDGDLSRLETNTRLNSLVSHEYMVVNPKGEPAYTDRFFSILFIGTNKPVKITDAKSGILRRLIDVSPTGEKIPYSEYKQLMKQIPFELGAIAYHCKEVYLDNPDYYDNYVPTTMLGASNDFYNYVSEYYYTFKDSDETSLKQAWEMYKTYCAEARVAYPYSQRAFKEELKNYFDSFYERYTDEDGSRIRNFYKGFKVDKFEPIVKEAPVKKKDGWIKLKAQPSLLDTEFKSYPAQYANEDGTPAQKWSNVTTKLKDIDTSKLHYVKVPVNQIFIDFDIKDDQGNKSFELNLREANKWPPTYAEVSKSGVGIHLHYLYEGDVTKLSNIFDDEIEIKVLNGNASLRRKLTKCNDIPITTINSGLPLKGEKIKMATSESIKSERSLRTLIKRNLNKEIHPGTKPSIDFIYKILEDAYNSGLKYDVSNMKNEIFDFAANSTNHAKYCTELVMKMKFKSEEPTEETTVTEDKIVFYDVEVFPNLLLVNWKYQGEKSSVVRMINPSDRDIEKLCKYKLVGFNNRRYDNHILYGRMMGYSNEQIYELSRRIIAGDRNAFFGEAYNLSYTDIYDYSSKKQSLKKWEIELGIHHQELGLPWDKPVPEDMWYKVAEYCDNDVIATEAVWDATQGDFLAREILAAVTGMTVNDTTNSLTQRLIFGNERHPQDSFTYRDLSKPVAPSPDVFRMYGEDREYRIFDAEGNPTYETYIRGKSVIPLGYSILPFFPGYTFDHGVSTYLGDVIGEGGRVYSKPGAYNWVWDGDVSSMHPHSIISENLFGPFTKTFEDLVESRVDIKHKDFESAKQRLGGKLAPFITDESKAKQLSQALKIAINSVYGLTSAKFANVFRDNRNVDNIVAKRGALFMTKLKAEVEKRGFEVCHIKTDSIKIPNANEDIKDFVISFGKEYGYDFETEAEFIRFAIVNDAVYVAQHKDSREWTATGTQFQVPYVFKTLFSHEPIKFEDMCETKAVSKGDLYLDYNEHLPDVSLYERIRDIRKKIKDGNATKSEVKLNNDYIAYTDEMIEQEIAKGHEYVFVGRVGLFCPVKDGSDGGLLYRYNDGKYYAAPGTTGYRWLEAERVKTMHQEDCINREYYDKLVKEARNEIDKYTDFVYFSNSDYTPPIPYYEYNPVYKINSPSPFILVDELPF